MKLSKVKKFLAVLVAAATLSSVPAAVGAVNDFNIQELSVTSQRVQRCFEKYKEQFADQATKSNMFEIIKQYQDRADDLIMIFENHEDRICQLEGGFYSPKSDLSSFEKGKYDNCVYDSELIIKRCKNHSIYDEYFEKFEDDGEAIDIIEAYQEMFECWIPMLNKHEKRIQAYGK